MNIQPILIRREIWEHRSLWIVPLVVAALIIIAAMFPHSAMSLDDNDLNEARHHASLFAQFHSALTLPQFFLLAILLPFYLLDCLYAERKDRSILFWKSLPVSDAQTVLSKLIVALAIVPLGVYALTIVTDIVASAILAVRFGDSQMMRTLLRWDMGMWLQTQGFILCALIMVMLWYAPLAAYLLLVSAWAKRNVMLWAILPPLLALIVEKIAYHTNYVGRLLAYRMNGIWGTIAVSHHFSGKTPLGGTTAALPMAQTGPFTALQNIDLWLGLIVTVLLVWLTIRIRRHQTES
jgi:ABC-2 type transport system permease protein